MKHNIEAGLDAIMTPTARNSLHVILDRCELRTAVVTGVSLALQWWQV